MSGVPASYHRTLLLVDDCAAERDLYEIVLRPEFRVLTAARGADGFAAAVESRPDVIVLDVMMPGIDGLEVARRLRSEADTRSIPIILLSAKAQNQDIQAGLAVADEYITKPFEPLELLERVATVIARSHANSRADGSAAGRAPTD